MLKIRPWSEKPRAFCVSGALAFAVQARRQTDSFHLRSNARMSNRPTPAEAMALYYSLDRPSSYEVAARFTAAGRPISAKSITRWKKQGWQGVPKAPRTDRATPAEAQAMWENLEKPTYYKVAAALKAQGRQVCHGTIWNWKRAGWSGVTAKTVAKTNKAIRTKAAAASARTSNKPTPAEAMALYYRLDRPSSREVAARFTAAGRPIVARTITRWKRQGWPGVANAPRTKRPTPAEAQAIWDSLEQPTLHKVANAFKAQGRPIGHVAIWSWKQVGWSRVTAKNAVAKATRAIEKIAAAVPALTGDPMTTLSDIMTGNNVVPDERHDDERNNDKRHNDARSNAEHAEQVLLRTIRTATVVNKAIHDIAAAVPKAGTPVPKDAPLPLLLTRPEGIAGLMMASNAGISVAIEVMRRLPAMRAQEAAEVPGLLNCGDSALN
jgi:hypothetical protein